nr:RNA-directed DNA polymerase, eukaryota [Tanacetum cinerariifolium]
MEGFNSFVETTRKSLNIVEPNGLIQLKKKLQALKIAIKAWSKEANKRSNDKKINIQQNLSEVDKLIDQGKSNDEILIKRITLLNDLQELNNMNAMEISQKVKMRWSIEGDENSNYFHDQVQDLECTITYEEVKRAVWDCGTNKSPGPDGFSFDFYRKYWTTIDDDVDFEKAFDSVKWDYLDETLKAFGFGLKWRNWIISCLNNAMGSVLVNGSPTLEFQFHKGFKARRSPFPFKVGSHLDSALSYVYNQGSNWRVKSFGIYSSDFIMELMVQIGSLLGLAGI